jgi:hypothetical protein
VSQVKSTRKVVGTDLDSDWFADAQEESAEAEFSTSTDDSIYADGARDELLGEDEISVREAAFMEGYEAFGLE